MKLLSCTVIALLGIVLSFERSLAGPGPYSEMDSTVVSGTIIDFKPGSDGNFISFFTYDLKGQQTKHAIVISPDGSFSAKLFQPYVGDISMSFKEINEFLYVIPRDHLFLTLHGNGASTDAAAVVAVKGRSAATNNELFQFWSQFRRHEFLHKTDISNKEQTDSVFAGARKEQLNEELEFLERFHSLSAVKDQTFKKWAKSYLRYDAAVEINFFPFSGKLNRDISYEGLFSLLGGILSDDSSALRNSRYYDLLHGLSSSLVIILNLNPKYSLIKRTDDYHRLSFILDRIDERFAGTTRDLLYMNCYLNLAIRDTSNLTRKRVYATIKDVYVRKLCQEASKPGDNFVRYDVGQRLKALPLNKNSKDKLLAILEREKGTNLFIDFWGSWRAPCMEEMPHYPQLIAALKGQPLKFLFFSVDTRAETMKEIKQEYGIDAEFINLNTDEADMMNKVFNFSSYPHHFIVNGKGFMVNDTVTNFISGGKIDNYVIEGIKKSIAD